VETGNLRDALPENTLLLLYVGNFESYQGVELLLAAMDELKPESAADLMLVGGGANEESLRQRAETGPARGRIHFVGRKPVADLPWILDQADVLVSPRSKGVNTPMKIYAYLEAGRPILATRIVSHTQILNDETALLVEPNARSIAEGIQKLREDPLFREKLAKEAKTLSQSFSRESLKHKVLSTYEALAGVTTVGGKST